jgi:hypothetical protein
VTAARVAYPPSARVTATLVFLYVAVMAGVAALADRGHPPFQSGARLASLALVQVLSGLLIARWWALALPLAAIVVAVPFGDPETPPDAEVPVWLGIAFRAPLLIALVAIGILLSRFLLARGLASDDEVGGG